ncbi:hypothetical protein KKA13_02160 [Patescibacteria group bacterium]|nr:hypothetical protein [Patescibacteria group bacterium]MBU1613302.1 hypothetical protein [Patescibacteria group bacterium]
MNSAQIKRIVSFIKRTGDPCVILDAESDEALTLLRLDDYERLLDSSWGEPLEGMSEREMMDKVNRDIAYWKSCHEDEEEEVEGCHCAECGRADENLVSELNTDVPMSVDFEDDDFVEEEMMDVEPTVEPILGVEAPMMAAVESQNGVESKPEELPEEEADTFLLEPV